jgi:hypothetical protein
VRYAVDDHGRDVPAWVRPATPGQNAGNMRPQEGRTSRYKGVSWASDRGKWQAHIKLNRVNRSLGRFDREEDAADAYDRAALEAWGEYAYLNNARMGAAA